MKRILIACALTTLPFLRAIADDTAIDAERAQFWTVAPSVVSRLNVRESASTGSSILDKVRRGTLLKVDPSRSVNGFFYVIYNTGLSEGYIAARLLIPMNNLQKTSINTESLEHLTRLLKQDEL